MAYGHGLRLTFRRALFVFAVCGAFGVTACANQDACDEAALAKVSSSIPQAVSGGAAGAAERLRVSTGVRAACPGMAEWMRARMMRSYETSDGFSDENAAWLENEEVDLGRKASAPLRNRVCPEFDTFLGFTPKPQPRGMEAPELTPTEQRKQLWSVCDLGRFGLYTAQPQPGAHGPSGIFDFSVFLYLKDGGVSEATATAIVRGLGKKMPY